MACGANHIHAPTNRQNGRENTHLRIPAMNFFFTMYDRVDALRLRCLYPYFSIALTIPMIRMSYCTLRDRLVAHISHARIPGQREQESQGYAGPQVPGLAPAGLQCYCSDMEA